MARDNAGDYRIGNRDPNKRGLNKEIKRAKSRGKKRSGCPLFLLVVLGTAVGLGFLMQWIFSLFA